MSKFIKLNDGRAFEILDQEEKGFGVATIRCNSSISATAPVLSYGNFEYYHVGETDLEQAITITEDDYLELAKNTALEELFAVEPTTDEPFMLPVIVVTSRKAFTRGKGISNVDFYEDFYKEYKNEQK